MHPRRSIAAALTCAAVFGAIWIRTGAIPPELLDLREAASTVVVDRNGVPLYEALSSEGGRSIHLTAGDLPPAVVAATLAAEDRRFWSHVGVDPIAMLRAARRNLAEGRVVEGASTITQQVAKLLLNRRVPDRRRGWREKIREAIFAIRLENRFSKREILALYLNLASYGNQLTGVQRASRAYFGHDASMLTTAQAAFIAGLPQRPSTFNPYRSERSALARQQAVLRRMESTGLITPDQAREARAERLSLSRSTAPFLAPHFVEMVLAHAPDPRPARIETTIDAGLQADIAGIIRSQRAALDRIGASNVAVVVLDNQKGEWIAWEGSGDYFDATHGGTINGAVAARQPGSTLKPFTYALAFEEGLTPASVLADIPSHFPTAEEGVLYSPRNYDGRFRGPLLARRALAGSENVPAVALASSLGVPKLIRFLTRAGLTTFDRNSTYYGLGVTLGNAEVRLDELVAAYAMFARGGEAIEPTWIRAGAPGRRRQLISPRSAYWITDILSDAEAREYIFGRGGSLELPFPVAVKTGTSQAYHDNWTVGYTRKLTVGVWVGNFDRKALRNSTGVSGAGPMFHAVMLAAARRVGIDVHGLAVRDIVPRPDGLVRREFCSLSGTIAARWCPSRQREWVMPGADRNCDWHTMSDAGPLVIWPAEFRQWARENGLVQPQNTRSEPVHRAVAAANGGATRLAELEIANPPSGATYLIDPTLRPEFQTLSLRAVASRPGRIEWQVDGRTLGATSSESPLVWQLAAGRHRIVARDERGHTAEATIVVR